jgi:hypothetical protein
MSQIVAEPAEGQILVCHNSGKDKRQQKAMKTDFEQRVKQSEPEKLAVLQYFKKGTPMFGHHAEGGPLLGWSDFPIVCTAGATVYRFYHKDKLEDEVNVTWITEDLKAWLNAEADKLKAARGAGTVGPDPVFIGIPATSDKFKY